MFTSVAPWIAPFAERAHLVAAALEYAGGTHTVSDVAAGIEAGTFQMFIGPHSILITELTDYPRSRDCHVFLAGGILEELEVITPHMEAWAKKQGCTRVTLAGRKGWARTFLAARDYKPQWYVMSKDLGR